MITKAKIEKVVDNNQFVVRIPTINKASNVANSTPFNELYTATLSCPAGVSPALRVGDIVFVGFEDNLLRQPIIIGMLFSPNNIDSRCGVNTNSIVCDVSCNLPISTTIGTVTGNEIESLSGISGNIQRQIDALKDRVAKLEEEE